MEKIRKYTNMAFTISINPSYGCNFANGICSKTCYLGDKLHDFSKIDLLILKKRLQEVKEYTEITAIDLYGGEISTLPDKYFYELISVIESEYSGVINIITNLYVIKDYFKEDKFDISVSWDYKVRQHWDRVLYNIINLGRPVSVLMLAKDSLMQIDPDEIIKFSNNVPNIISIEIKPYSKNFYNTQSSSFEDYENWIIKWISSKVKKNFEFINVNNIKQSLLKAKNSFSDNHIYITPKGNFAVLEFDNQDLEYFLNLSSFEDYILWCDKEKEKIETNAFCSICTFKGHCLSEHLQNVKSLENSCNGFINLLKWSKNKF